MNCIFISKRGVERAAVQDGHGRCTTARITTENEGVVLLEQIDDLAQIRQRVRILDVLGQLRIVLPEIGPLRLIGRHV